MMNKAGKTTIVALLITALAITMIPTQASAAAKIKTPGKFSASGSTYNSVKIKWKKTKGASGYKVYRATKKKGRYKCIKTLSSKASSYTNKKLKPGRTYYYKVRAYKKSSKKKTVYSPYTKIKSAKGKVGRPGSFKAVGTSTSDQAKISWKKVSGATSYRIYRASSKNGKYKHIKTASKNQTVYYDKSRKSGAVYYYKLRAVTKAGRKSYFSSYTAKDPAAVKSKIMGSSKVTAAKLANYYRKHANYPSYYATNKTDKSANTLQKFCELYVSECRAEGVRADVAFCQAMKETGWLTFKGDVKISQFNFAGIGATGGKKAGNRFATVRTGIRAQIQHLKAYASKSSLKKPCVDPRFKYVRRGSAAYVEWLGIKENPNGGGWAAARNYGYDIMKMVREI